jgi:hypothetical protein
MMTTSISLVEVVAMMDGWMDMDIDGWGLTN